MDETSGVRSAGFAVFGVGLLGFLSCVQAVPDDPLVKYARLVSLAVMLVGTALAMAPPRTGRR